MYLVTQLGPQTTVQAYSMKRGEDRKKMASPSCLKEGNPKHKLACLLMCQRYKALRKEKKMLCLSVQLPAIILAPSFVVTILCPQKECGLFAFVCVHRFVYFCAP